MWRVYCPRPTRVTFRTAVRVKTSVILRFSRSAPSRRSESAPYLPPPLLNWVKTDVASECRQLSTTGNGRGGQTRRTRDRVETGRRMRRWRKSGFVQCIWGVVVKESAIETSGRLKQILKWCQQKESKTVRRFRRNFTVTRRFAWRNGPTVLPCQTSLDEFQSYNDTVHFFSNGQLIGCVTKRQLVYGSRNGCADFGIRRNGASV